MREPTSYVQENSFEHLDAQHESQNVENEIETKAPKVIEVTGRIGLNSKINGTYFRAEELHNNRACYHKQDNSLYIYWHMAKKTKQFLISDILGDSSYNAYLGQDTLYPINSDGKHWVVYDGEEKGENEDMNTVSKAITKLTKNLQRTDYIDQTYENWTQKLNDGAKLGDKEQVQLTLNEEESEQSIEWLIKENNRENSLHYAAENGFKEIAQVLLDVFIEDKKENLIKFVMKENQEKDTALHLASLKGHVETVKLLLNVFSEQQNDSKHMIRYLMNQKQNQFNEDTIHAILNLDANFLNSKLIEYVTKENVDEKTALHFAIENGNKEIIELMLNVFNEDNKKKLLNIVMKKNFTALHSGAAAKKEKILKENEKKNPDPEITNLLLNVFREDKNEKLIEYVMKEDENKNTILHIALENGKNKEFVELLLNSNIFSKNQHAKLMKYILKKNNKNLSARQIAHKYHEEKSLYDATRISRIRDYAYYDDFFLYQQQQQNAGNYLHPHHHQHTAAILAEIMKSSKFEPYEQNEKLLFKTFENAKILGDLQLVLKLFNRQSSDEKKESSSILQILNSRFLGSDILKFLITDFDLDMHGVQEEEEQRNERKY